MANLLQLSVYTEVFACIVPEPWANHWPPGFQPPQHNKLFTSVSY